MSHCDSGGNGAGVIREPRHSIERSVGNFQFFQNELLEVGSARMSANVCSATVVRATAGTSQAITSRRKHSLRSIWSWPADLVVISLIAVYLSRNAPIDSGCKVNAQNFPHQSQPLLLH